MPRRKRSRRRAATPRFLVATYLHLFAAIVLFVAFEWWLFASGWSKVILRPMLSVPWPVVLAAFGLVAWYMARWASRLRTTSGQRAALAGYIAVKGLLFVPLLTSAERVAPGVGEAAGAQALLGASVLTLIVFWARKDFSFLRAFLYWGGIVAFGAIILAWLTDLRLGPLFSLAMVAYAGAAILYDTSQLVRGRGPRRPPAAALRLFASMALLLWYLVRLTRRQARL